MYPFWLFLLVFLLFTVIISTNCYCICFLLSHQNHSFRPKTRKRVYNPPEDLMEKLQAVTLEVLPDKAEGDWTEVDLKDNLIKYQVGRLFLLRMYFIHILQ